MTIPSQGETDFDKPEEHHLWALRGLPWGDTPSAIPRPILERWSKHLVATGTVHVSSLWKLADDEGKIHLNDLPKQQIKYIQPGQGQEHALNAAGKWVSVDTPEPDYRLSPEQADALMDELERQGYL